MTFLKFPFDVYLYVELSVKIEPEIESTWPGNVCVCSSTQKKIEMIFLKEKKTTTVLLGLDGKCLDHFSPNLFEFVTYPSSWQPINSPWRELISDRQACSSKCTLFGFPQNLSKSIKGRQQIAHPISLFGFPPDLSKSTWLSFRRLIKIVIFANIK